MPKDIKWHTRAANDATDNVYMFRKSLDRLKNRDLVRKELLFEKALSVFCNNGNVPAYELSRDPLLSYVCGIRSTPPSTETILRYYGMDAQNFLSGSSFVDMCLIFHQVDVAHDFANHHGVDYEILHLHQRVVKNASCSISEIFSMEISRNWLNVLERGITVPAERKLKSAERIVFVLRFISGQKLEAICEMAARGYRWDAFILMSVFFPEHDLTMQFRSMVWKIYDLSWLDNIISLKSTADVGILLNMGMDHESIYRSIKDSLRVNTDNVLVLNNSFRNMRICLLATVSHDTIDVANNRAGELFELVKKESALLAEFLPALEHINFEAAFIIMADLIKAVLLTYRGVRFPERPSGSGGFLFRLLKDMGRYKFLSGDISTSESRLGISSIIYKFIGDVNACTDIKAGRNDHKELVILALRIGELMLKDGMDAQNAKLLYPLVVDSPTYQQMILVMLSDLNSIPNNATMYEYLAIPMQKLLSSVCELLGLDPLVSNLAAVDIKEEQLTNENSLPNNKKSEVLANTKTDILPKEKSDVPPNKKNIVPPNKKNVQSNRKLDEPWPRKQPPAVFDKNAAAH